MTAKTRAKELLDAKELLMTAKAQIGKQRRKTLCGSAKQLLDAKGKATAQAAARQQQHRYVITSYKQAMYSRSAAGVIELLT